MISSVVIPTSAALLSTAIIFFGRILYRNWTSPLRFVDGPSASNPIFGHFKMVSDIPEITNKWREQYGATFMAKGLFLENQLHTKDLKAISHILSHGSRYPKTYAMTATLRRTLGKGILSVEMDHHRRQRKILNPAFGLQQIRMMNEVFVEKGNMLRDMLMEEIEKAGGTFNVNLSSWFRQVTLDIIGETGFNYQFNSLKSHGKDEGELSTVFGLMFHNPKANLNRAVQFAQVAIPFLQSLPLPGWRVTRFIQKRMHAIGKQLVEKSKAEAASLGEKDLGSGRDILSLLLRANMSNDIPEGQRMTEEEVIAQIPTFVLAGHETTSTALAWVVHILSRHQSVQDELRQELLSVPSENPTMDELNALPLLEKVIRETMRLHAPAVYTNRVAVQDDVLPLSKPYIDRYGVSHETLPIRKGQVFTIPILAINTDKEIWGDDALEFKVERWDNLPEAVHGIPTVWANQLTFLAGPHSCMGFRFTIVEQKAILFGLLRNFVFLPGSDNVEPAISGLFQRPISFVASGQVSGKVGADAEKSGLISLGGLQVVLKPYKGQGAL
ncbi:unnamed protein product [Mycena citricolor]|uniref:Cytochrome P450 n=1 Tax=Mycena citricolor TaxID=2018698 RepID=A0AAD2JXA8_9AGAR|nr:unnamed protein product [Mycena citricolor]